MKKTLWGKIDNQDIYSFELTAGDYKAVISNYGALLTHLYMPNNQGHIDDIVLGFNELEGYLGTNPYFGATVGRFGNRIKNACFELEGQIYKLSKNEGHNQLHGGLKGFDKQIWQAEEIAVDKGEAIKLIYISQDGEEGFPGTLTAEVIYHLLDDGRLFYDVKASSDKTTICSIINHSYFNLAGSGNILDHELQINSADYTEVDNELIPTGKLVSVKDTGLDFTQMRSIKEAVAHMEGGLHDHNLILADYTGKMRKVALLQHKKSGRSLEISTTLPCVQIYNSATMSSLNITDKKGGIYPDHAGLCLETQFAPNSMNEPSFESPILKAGDIWHHQTLFHMHTLRVPTRWV